MALLSFHSINRKWLLVAIGWPLAFFIDYFFSQENTFKSPDYQFITLAFWMVAIPLAGFILTRCGHWLDTKISWRESFITRFTLGLITNMAVVSVLVLMPVFYWSLTLPADVVKLGIVCVFALVIYEIFYGWFYSYTYFAQKQVESLKLDRLQLELQIESLKSQISPHFLFNCLNTVSSLIYKDTRLAEEFIRRMADTFQYVLKNQKQKLVSLREELDFMKSYHYLMQVRYQNSLKLEINLPSNLLDTFVPPLTLQILMENSVKHNLISPEHPMLVYLSARDNTHIIVTNTKTKQNPNATGFQVGLETIKKRYGYYSTQKIIVTDSDKYSIQLPVLKKGIAI